MESFKRNPTIRMLATEVRDTTVELQSGGDKYKPTIYFSPTGAEVNRVLIAGTAVEKEDVGSDNSFWRVRVADPTGAIFVYAGQYQPEAAKVIQKLEVPCFVIVSGKLAHYTPEQGGDIIVSVRAESIASVSIERRDLALADIAHHTVKRFLEVKKNEKVQDNYPNYDYNTFVQSISTLLDQILEEPAQAVNDSRAAPASQPVQPSTSAVTPPSSLVVQAPDTQTPKPVTEPPVKPPVQEHVMASAAPEKPKRNRKKGGAKNASLDQVAKEIPKEPVKEPPKEAPKEARKAESKPNGLQDSACFILDILKTHKQEPGIPKDTIQNVLRSLGYAMLDVDSILAKLKTSGEIIEPKNGFFRAV